MAKYLISWEESIWMNLEIEAASKEEALQKFADNDYDREDVMELEREWNPGSEQCEEV